MSDQKMLILKQDCLCKGDRDLLFYFSIIVNTLLCLKAGLGPNEATVMPVYFSIKHPLLPNTGLDPWKFFNEVVEDRGDPQALLWKANF